MVNFPQLWELIILLAVVSITLITTSEMLSLNYGRIRIRLNRRRLRKSAMLTSFLFLIAMTIRILQVII